jgi:hypothetical protein
LTMADRARSLRSRVAATLAARPSMARNDCRSYLRWAESSAADAPKINLQNRILAESE